MKVHTARRLCLLLLLAVFLCAYGCGPKEPTMAQAGEQNELGQEFMGELAQSILPNKENNDYLRSLGVLLSEEEVVKDMSAFDAFMQAWESGEDAVLTISFRTKSEVYARLQWKGGAGYYFRYEVPKEEDAEIAVVGKLFDNMELTRDEALGKLQLKLTADKQDVAIFTFRPAEVPEENGGDAA